MTGTELITKILEDRRRIYGYDVLGDERPENWEDLDSMGLSKQALEELGPVVAVSSKTKAEWAGEQEIVWLFASHKIYLRDTVVEGSYDHGYKLYGDMEQVFPKSVQMLVYDTEKD